MLMSVVLYCAVSLGKYMGLNPATYRKYKADASTPTGDGMNFAVGGAGVFNNLGFTKTSDQIAQFKALLDANVYDSSSVFNESVILFAISGNDYAAYTRNLAGSVGSPPKILLQFMSTISSVWFLTSSEFLCHGNWNGAEIMG